MPADQGSNLFNQQASSGGNKTIFPNPFLDYTSLAMPRNMEDVFDWAEYMWLTNGTYRMALQRIVRYFITDITIEGTNDSKEAAKFREILLDNMNILSELTNIGDDTISVGNSFSSLYEPIDRFLRCPCGAEAPIKKVDYAFLEYQFVGTCKACGRQDVKFDRQDRSSKDVERYRIIRWNSRDIKIKHNPVNGATEHFWKIDAATVMKVKQGDKFTLETINWEIIESIQADVDFKFHPDKLYHNKESTVSSIRSGGWGLPRIISVLKQAWYVQVLHRQNEAIAQDYILPFRVISPGRGPGNAADPLLSVNMGDFMGSVKAMISEHRRDPATYHTMPVPLEYQALSGEGAQLVVPELLRDATETLLNALGVPIELYQGNLKINGAPLALRMFERIHADLASGLNGWLKWLVKQLGDSLQWDDVTCHLRSPTIAEDLERKQVLLQLQGAGLISKETAFAPWDINPKSEQTKIIGELREEAEHQYEAERDDAPAAEVQEIMDMNQQMAREQELIDKGLVPDPAAEAQAGEAAAGMGPAPQGAPPAGGGGLQTGNNESGSIYEMDQQATDIATQLLAMPESQRRSEMISLKHSDEALHALVKSKMEGMRQQAGQQGKQQMEQELAGQQQ